MKRLPAAARSMPEVQRSDGAASWSATLSVAAFWVATAVAAAGFSGYDAREDVVSTLAGRGSPVAPLGIAALLVLAAAHAAAGRVHLVHGRRPEGWLLLGAAVATVVVAAFRVSIGRADDAVDLVHAAGVVGFELLLLAAMASTAVRALRRPARRRLSAVLSVVAATGSVLLLMVWSGTPDDAGLWQRLWLATNLSWLLLVTWAVRRRG